MQFTLQEESALVDRYAGLLRKVVRRFYSAHESLDFEDLMQEATIAFIEHLRAVESADNVGACKETLFRALYDHARQMHLVKIPHYAFHAHQKGYRRAPTGALDVMPDQGTEDEWICDMALRDLLAGASPKERLAIVLKLHGYSPATIRAAMGFTNRTQTFHLMRHLRARLAMLIEEE